MNILKFCANWHTFLIAVFILLILSGAVQAQFKDSDLTTEFSYYGPMAGFNFRF